MSGIYIHIPFCKQACTYCNFHFSTTYASYREVLIQSIVKEIKLRDFYLVDKNLDSIYFGGGTPSLLNREELNRIFEAISKYYSFDFNETEITLEANPDDLTINKIKDFKSVGINRLSIGVQSFHDPDLSFMNRSHNANEALKAIKDSQNLGFDNISIDLIFGLPNTSSELWHENLQISSDLELSHLSVYNLTVEPKTKLYHDIIHNKVTIANDEQSAEQFYYAKTFLKEKGFDHYEISNYAKQGYIAKHNTNYWKSVPYIGLGPGAHSFNGQERQWNISNNIKYIDSIKKGLVPFSTEVIYPKEKYNEYIITGLRTKWGCNLDLIENIDKKYKIYFLDQVKKHIHLQNIKQIDNLFQLTKEGLIYSDLISSDLLYVS